MSTACGETWVVISRFRFKSNEQMALLTRPRTRRTQRAKSNDSIRTSRAVKRLFPAGYPPVPIVRLSVEQYHDLLDVGILWDGDPIELLEGWMVPKDASDDLPRDTLPSEQSPDVPSVPIWRLTVPQYHQLLQAEILKCGDPIELLEGWLVPKMTKNPPHMVACELLSEALRSLLVPGWFLKFEAPLSLDDSEPEPDLSVIRGKSRDYIEHHPRPKEAALVIEVADTSRVRDLGLKKRLYARAKIQEYWVVNLPESRLEVFRDPTGPVDVPDYRKHQSFTSRQKVPFALDGKKLGSLLVADVLP